MNPCDSLHTLGKHCASWPIIQNLSPTVSRIRLIMELTSVSKERLPDLKRFQSTGQRLSSADWLKLTLRVKRKLAAMITADGSCSTCQ